MYFFALSQAPPLFAEEVAIDTPETKMPGNNPATAVGPNNKPMNNGAQITSRPGANISLNAPFVEMSMHLS
jgi:hypothetical protein